MKREALKMNKLCNFQKANDDLLSGWRRRKAARASLIWSLRYAKTEQPCRGWQAALQLICIWAGLFAGRRERRATTEQKSGRLPKQLAPREWGAVRDLSSFGSSYPEWMGLETVWWLWSMVSGVQL